MADVVSAANSPAPAPPYVPRLMRLTLKEMRETLRDRRTIITLLLMPILLYPLLTLAFQRFVLSTATNAHVEYILGIESQQAASLVTECILWANIGRREKPAKAATSGLVPAVEPLLKYEVTDFLEREVREFHIDVGLRLKRDAKVQFRPNNDIAVDFELIYQPGNRMGERARDHIAELLKDANTALLRYRLKTIGVTQRPQPLNVEEVPLRDPAEIQNQMLSAIIPVVLILMTITGAVYPAIDLTAGERERGTLEMLVAAPVPRLGLLFAKYVAVLSVAFLTAAINLGAMTVTLMVSGMGTLLFGERGLSLLSIFEVFCLLILFASFFSALLLTLTSFARSFKEAQAYLIPLMLVSLGPGLVGLLPGLKLTGALQVAPLVNVVLLSRDLLQGQASFLSCVLVVASTLLYAAAALALAARVFGTHAILYESQTAWADLFRRPDQPQSAPQVASAMLCLALLFPICFVLKGLLGQLSGDSIERQLLATSVGTFAAFMVLPWWAARAGNVPFRLAFPLRWPHGLALLGALLCGVSLWPFAHEIVVTLNSLGLATIEKSQLEQARQLIERFRQAPLPLVLMTIAALPGICEEFCFRGYVYRALEPRLTAWQTILSTGVIFGLFHLVAVDHLAIERLAPTTFLGLVLGWIRSRTGSILPGMLLHVCHNGLLAVVMYYEHQLTARGWGVAADENQHLPAAWLAGATFVAVIGFSLIALASGPRKTRDDGAEEVEPLG